MDMNDIIGLIIADFYIWQIFYDKVKRGGLYHMAESMGQPNYVLQFKEHHYTMFNPEIDFAKIVETHTPLKIEYKDA